MLEEYGEPKPIAGGGRRELLRDTADTL